MRGFEKAKGFEHLDFDLPRRSTLHSAGYDIAIIEDIEIEPGDIKSGVTGIKAFMMDDELFRLLYIILGIKKCS